MLFKDAMFIDNYINRTKHLDEIFNINNFVPYTIKVCSWMRVMMHAIDIIWIKFDGWNYFMDDMDHTNTTSYMKNGFHRWILTLWMKLNFKSEINKLGKINTWYIYVKLMTQIYTTCLRCAIFSSSLLFLLVFILFSIFYIVKVKYK